MVSRFGFLGFWSFAFLGYWCCILLFGRNLGLDVLWVGVSRNFCALGYCFKFRTFIGCYLEFAGVLCCVKGLFGLITSSCVLAFTFVF